MIRTPVSPGSPPSPHPRRRAAGLVALFGTLAFLQGIIEPTEGLPAQPARSLLKGWGRDDAEVAGFVALLAAPWWLKPLYGLLSDLVPLAGSRRRSYLILGGLAAAVGYGGLGLQTGESSPRRLLGWLLVPTTAVAFADVVADALMIELGRPLGLVGRFQAAQWGSTYAAALLIGPIGGRLATPGRQPLAFLACAALATLSAGIVLAFVRDPPDSGPRRRVSWREARGPGLLGVAAFLFLWNFNPFSNAVLYLHLTRGLGLSEPAAGDNATAFAAACLVASVAYGFVSRRVPIRALVRASVPLGVLSTLAYWGLVDARSALPVTLVAGFLYQFATLTQLDLAARACPPAAAGTLFASLMAMENIAASMSTGLGGLWYQRWGELWGHRAAFQVLVGIGAAFTAGCWWLLPLALAAAEPAESA